MTSSRRQADSMEEEELTCSPFRMMDPTAPHSSSGSSGPAPLGPRQGDLVSTAGALAVAVPAAARRLRACRVWLIRSESPSQALAFQAVGPQVLEAGDGPHSTGVC